MNLYSYKQILESFPEFNLRELDFHVANYLSDKSISAKAHVYWLTLALSSEYNSGKIAVFYSDLGKKLGMWNRILLSRGEAQGLVESLSSVLREDGTLDMESISASGVVGSASDDLPLVYENGWVYFRKNRVIEDLIVGGFLSRLRPDPLVPVEELQEKVGNIESEVGEIDWQKLAVWTGLIYPCAVITGGPGTGKTRTVLSMLSKILEFRPEFRIALCAPTGKAATRILESIRVSLSLVEIEENIQQLLPKEAFTIHRLLGYNPVSGKTWFNEKKRLPYDMVILDEASMVDASLLSKLMLAMNPSCRIVLLGDKDQLASVEAGAVFGDIASETVNQKMRDNSGEQINRLGEISDFRDVVVMLEKSWRFESNSNIARLTNYVNAGDSEQSWNLLKSAESELRVLEGAVGHMDLLFNQLENHYLSIVKEESPLARLKKMTNFQLLAAHRNGKNGSEWMNRYFDDKLRRTCTRLGKKVEGDWFDGRLIMMQSNNYQLGLFNGDTGVVCEIEGKLMAFFQNPGKGSTEGDQVRIVPLSRLNQVDLAWAITIHKSQGSEYERVFIIFPDGESQVLTRELCYTGISRARKEVKIFASKEVWNKTLSAKSVRYSGISNRLRQVHK